MSHVFRLFLFVFLILPVCARDVVVAPEPIAARVGMEVLKNGGNAFDAAVAIGFALAVTYPQAGNIGGGGFAMLVRKGSDPVALDFRETAPMASSEKMYLDKKGDVIPGLSTQSALSAGVPGSIKGLWEIWEKYGVLPFEKVVRPSVDLASQGIVISKCQAGRFGASREKLMRDPDGAELFVPGGQPLAEGAKLLQPQLAHTLGFVAKNGESVFYQGAVGREFVQEITAKGGIITEEDLRLYRVVWRTPVQWRFHKDTLFMMSLPSSGGIAVSEILGLLSQFDTHTLTPRSSQYVHLLSEIEKRVFADRNTYLGDPEYSPVRWRRLLDSEYLSRTASKIPLDRAVPSDRVQGGYGAMVAAGMMLEESKDTTSYLVLDDDGNCISVTYTLNGAFGSGILLPETGILLNNEMDDFAIKPGIPNMYGLVQGRSNCIQPGKRMLSSITPTIVLRDGSFRMALGSPGGSTIITTVLQMYLNVTLFGMSSSQAVDAPRFHHQWLPDEIRLEPELYADDFLRGNLEKMGHSCRKVNRLGDGVLILRDEKGRITASADKRGCGVALVE